MPVKKTASCRQFSVLVPRWYRLLSTGQTFLWYTRMAWIIYKRRLRAAEGITSISYSWSGFARCCRWLPTSLPASTARIPDWSKDARTSTWTECSDPHTYLHTASKWIGDLTNFWGCRFRIKVDGVAQTDKWCVRARINSPKFHQNLSTLWMVMITRTQADWTNKEHYQIQFHWWR